MRLEPGEVTHVLTIGEDITEQRGIEKSMMVAEKMAALGRVAAGVAHEINNPLAAIVTCAEGLGSRLRDLGVSAGAAVEFHEYLRIVEQEAYRAKRITEELLDFSRARKSPARPQSLEELLDRTLLIVKHSRGFQNVEVERIFEDDLPEVQVEEDAMVQALLNLILNAIDAMPGGGRLKLTTRRAGETVRCEVRDTGCGIARTDLPKIFEPFFTTKHRGTGLGLSISRTIVERNGGKIAVSSREGQGTRVEIELPVPPERKGPASRGEP
jgi:signal transduction histidine kinase